MRRAGRPPSRAFVGCWCLALAHEPAPPMEICRPYMGDPYAYAQSYEALGAHSSAPCPDREWPASMPWQTGSSSPSEHAGPFASRKRGWGVEDSLDDQRAVRHCAGGGGMIAGVTASVVSAAGGAAGSGLGEGAFGNIHTGQRDWEGSGGGFLQGGCGFAAQPTMLAHHGPAPPKPQQPQRLNAFDVLMSATPIKVDGFVCHTCLTQEARATAPCFHCGRSTCGKVAPHNTAPHPSGALF